MQGGRDHSISRWVGNGPRRRNQANQAIAAWVDSAKQPPTPDIAPSIRSAHELFFTSNTRSRARAARQRSSP
jgi:hypothetical protein